MLLEESLPWGKPFAWTGILLAFDGLVGVFELEAVIHVIGKDLSRR